MAFGSFRARVHSIRDLTHDVREIDFRLIEPKEIVFKAGQFISFELLAPRTGRHVVRPYSIASSPAEPDHVTIVFNRIPEGVGSTYLFGLAPGAEVTFQGPAGSFYLHDRSRDCLFVATGTGIAPIRSMLLDLFASPDHGTIRLYWGLRSPRDLYYQEDLQAWAAADRRFSFTTTLSNAGAGWKGAVGRVTVLVEKQITSVTNLAVYLCGNHQMIDDVTRLIRAKGLCPIYREIYYDDPPSHPDY